MATKSKPFRAFVEGETISDGRTVTAEMIDQCAATFNLDTYTPRINIEHISGYSPEPPFNGYGDVVALEAKTDEFTIAGTKQQRRVLYATVDGNDQLVALAKADQKPFPSVELTPSYAGTGKYGIIGLAFTDTPASIGTQRLQFSSRAPGSIFALGAEAVTIEFETPAQPDASAGAFAAMKAFFDRFTPSTAPSPTPPVTPPAPTPAAQTPPATPANDNFADLTAGLGLVAASITALGAKVDRDMGAIRTEFGAVKTQLERTEAPGFSRAPAPGGANAIVTDC